MLNTLHRILKLTIIFSTVISGWTLVLLSSNTTFNLEIKEVIHKMYLNQKNFIYNVKDLSLLLVKDANHRFSDNHEDRTKFNTMKNGFKN